MAKTPPRTTTLLTTLATAGLLAATVPGPAAAAPAEGQPLPGTYLQGTAGLASQALDVAENGAIAGTRTPAEGTPEAVVWRSGRAVTLAVPAGQQIPGYRVGAQAMKAEGRYVAGTVLANVMSPDSFHPGPALRWGGEGTVSANAGSLGGIQDLTAQGWAVATGYSSSSVLDVRSVVIRPDGTTFAPPLVGRALDGRGQVYGYRNVGSTGAEAVRFDGTTATVLAAPEGRSAAVSDVTAGGTACGSAFTVVPIPAPKPAVSWVDHTPVLWRPDGTRVDLPMPGKSGSCREVAGTVAAGHVERADGGWGAVLWIGGRTVEVGPTDADVSVTGVNSRGVVVGQVKTATGRTGFVATATSWRLLTAPGAKVTVPADINDAGIVVGTAFDADNQPRAIRWTASALLAKPAR